MFTFFFTKLKTKILLKMFLFNKHENSIIAYSLTGYRCTIGVLNLLLLLLCLFALKCKFGKLNLEKIFSPRLTLFWSRLRNFSCHLPFLFPARTMKFQGEIVDFGDDLVYSQAGSLYCIVQITSGNPHSCRLFEKINSTCDLASNQTVPFLWPKIKWSGGTVCLDLSVCQPGFMCVCRLKTLTSPVTVQSTVFVFVMHTP